jgi:hypothetical protein
MLKQKKRCPRSPTIGMTHGRLFASAWLAAPMQGRDWDGPAAVYTRTAVVEEARPLQDPPHADIHLMSSPTTSDLAGAQAQVQEPHLSRLLNSFGFDFTNPPLAVLLGAFVLLILVLRRLASGRTPNYPPGPKPLPMLGNALDMPDNEQWITFAKWGAQYGTSSSCALLDRHQ